MKSLKASRVGVCVNGCDLLHVCGMAGGGSQTPLLEGEVAHDPCVGGSEVETHIPASMATDPSM